MNPDIITSIISKLTPEDIVIISLPAFRGSLFSREWKQDKSFLTLAINVPTKFYELAGDEKQKFTRKELEEIRDYIIKISKEEYKLDEIWLMAHYYNNIRKNAVTVPNETYASTIEILEKLEDDYPEIHKKILLAIAEKSQSKNNK